nr:reverse transcriptase domain-containing protein [Tanacetum cinerariifolium]
NKPAARLTIRAGRLVPREHQSLPAARLTSAGRSAQADCRIRRDLHNVLICNDSKLIEKIEALATKINSQFNEIKGEMKEMQDGCNSCGGPHLSSKCDDEPMGGPKDKEANYAYGGYRGGG